MSGPARPCARACAAATTIPNSTIASRAILIRPSSGVNACEHHGDVVLARALAEELPGRAHHRFAHPERVELGGAPDRRAEPLLAVLLAAIVLALDDPVGVPDQHVVGLER